MSVVATGYNGFAAQAATAAQDQRFTTTSATLAIPSDLQPYYCEKGHTVLRQPFRLRASGGPSFSTNSSNQIIFDLPSDNWYDMRRGYITFDVSPIVTVGGTRRRLATGIWSIFYRMQTKLDTEMENLQEYNRWVSFMYQTRNEARQNQALFRQSAGVGTKSEREVWGATTKHYFMPVISGFLGTQALPLDKIGAKGQFILTMDDASKFVETDGTSPVVTISNVIFHMERIVPDINLKNRMDAAFSSSGLRIGFNTFNDYMVTVPVGATGMQTLIINQKYASLLDIAQIWIDQSTVNNTLIDDKFISWPRLTNRDQFVLNSARIPEEPREYGDQMALEAYFAYINWIQKWDLSGLLTITPPPVTGEEFALSNDKFFLIQDLNQYPYDKDIINPSSNSNDAIQMQWDLYLTAPLLAVFRSQFLIRYFRQITINSNRSVVVNF